MTRTIYNRNMVRCEEIEFESDGDSDGDSDGSGKGQGKSRIVVDMITYLYLKNARCQASRWIFNQS